MFWSQLLFIALELTSMKKIIFTTSKIFLELNLYILSINILSILLWWALMYLGREIADCSFYDNGLFKSTSISCPSLDSTRHVLIIFERFSGLLLFTFFIYLGSLYIIKNKAEYSKCGFFIATKTLMSIIRFKR